jgi:predicted lipid-binding transport protein (Tim44 family)
MEVYEIRLHEVLRGGLLVAITRAIHGTGMFVILRFDLLLAMAGLLAVAGSTGILYMLAQDFQDTQLRKRRRLREAQGHPPRNPEHDASAARVGN